MSNVLPLIIGGAALFYFMGKPKTASSAVVKNPPVPKNPPVVDCIDLGNNLLAFPRIQLPESELNSEAPMIIVLHGRNGNENQLANAIPKDLVARVFFIRANTKNNLFFIPRLKDKEEIVAPAIEKAGEDLLEGIDKLLGIYPTSKVILFTFSQGSGISLFLASKYPEKIDYVMAFSGSIPSLLFPNKKGKTKVMQYHGNLDTVVPFELGVKSYEAFKDVGYDIVFRQTKNSHIGPPKVIVNEFFKLADFV